MEKFVRVDIKADSDNSWFWIYRWKALRKIFVEQNKRNVTAKQKFLDTLSEMAWNFSDNVRKNKHSSQLIFWSRHYTFYQITKKHDHWLLKIEAFQNECYWNQLSSVLEYLSQRKKNKLNSRVKNTAYLFQNYRKYWYFGTFSKCTNDTDPKKYCGAVGYRVQRYRGIVQWPPLSFRLSKFSL